MWLVTGLLEHAMVKDASSELHVAAIEAMLEVASGSSDQFASLYKTQLSWLKPFLSHTDATGASLLLFCQLPDQRCAHAVATARADA